MAGEFLTVEDVMVEYRVRRGYAYRLASVRRWRRRRGADGRVRYQREDVEAALGNRRAPTVPAGEGGGHPAPGGSE
jgi:hypothetical protein